MMDFEKSARKTIKSIFPDSLLLGCFFHFTKALWNKEKKRVYVKKYMKETYIIIFALKIFFFIKEKEKENYLRQINEFYKEKEEFRIYKIF